MTLGSKLRSGDDLSRVFLVVENLVRLFSLYKILGLIGFRDQGSGLREFKAKGLGIRA